MQLLPPSSFETVHNDPLAEFTQTVSSIVNILDEYGHLRYGQVLYVLCVCDLK